MNYFRLTILIAILCSVFIPELSFAQEISRADQALNNQIGNFVRDVTNNPASAFYQYSRAMLLGFAFMGLAWAFINWSVNAMHLFDLALYMLSIMLVFTFFTNYNAVLSTFWGWSDSLASGLQIAAIDEADPLFIGSKLTEQMNNFFINDYSLWDGFSPLLTITIFYLITGLLNVVIFVISTWHIWGYAFVKVTGLFFVPLLMLPGTRSLFDAWFKLLLGFWFFNLFSKVVLVIYYLYFGAIFGALADPIDFDPVGDRLTLAQFNFHFLIGILFFLSTASFSSAVAGGFGGFSNVASRAGSAALSAVKAIAVRAAAAA